ncbi:MAG: hypothetical protein L7W43_12730, partial [Rubripirellula sp.]|nr:hypothetical protein [Rubripirellula sp.]
NELIADKLTSKPNTASDGTGHLGISDDLRLDCGCDPQESHDPHESHSDQQPTIHPATASPAWQTK